MKKQILATILALSILFSCGIIPAAAATPGEIQAEEDRVKALIASLDADKITKITIEQMTPNGMIVKESSSKEAIKAWVDLYKRMEITGVEFDYLSGGFGTVYIHDDRGKISMGYLAGEYITNESLITMVRIDNRAELYPDLERAIEMLIAVKKCWERLPSWLQWILRYFLFGWIWMSW